MSRLLFTWILLLTIGLMGIEAQTDRHVVSGDGCGSQNYEQQGYTVNSSRVETPFTFLPWIKAKKQRVATQIGALVDGKPFTYGTTVTESLEIINTEDFLPDTRDVRIRFRLEFVSAENCNNKRLDLVYNIYSTQIEPVLSSAPEARLTEKKEPETAAGLTGVDVPADRPFRFTPLVGYDSEQRLYGGGRFEQTRVFPSKFPFNTFTIEGYGSSRTKFLSVALSDADDSIGTLAHLDWALSFSHRYLPTATGDLSATRLSANFSGMTSPLWNGRMTARFGGLIEGGNQQSNLPAVEVSSDTVLDSSFGAVKFYSGVESRLRHHMFSISYGLQLGASSRKLRLDWLKHVGDIQHQFWYKLGSSRILDVESRLTIGQINVRRSIPLAERFFGGNAERLFIPGDSWQIRENPVIRAIPGATFYLTPEGAGGRSFFGYNLTAAFMIWRKPLVPTDLSSDPTFAGFLQDAIDSASNPFPYIAKDPHFTKLVSLLPSVQANLGALDAAVMSTQSEHPGQFEEEFDRCNGALKMAARRLNSALNPKNSEQYGNISALLSLNTKENRLAKVFATCLVDLNDKFLFDPQISLHGRKLEDGRSLMEREFQLIDLASAEHKALEDMAFSRRALNTLIYDASLYSFSPVFVLDVARLGRKEFGVGGTRYGPGVGLRVELVNSLNFTAGYAWNIRQGPGEKPGNVFFSMGIRDLFR